MGEDGVSFSLAWRVTDSQFWGVPQRRRRVCVLADFSGTSAAEILFNPKYERTSKDGYTDEAFRHSGTEDRPEIRSLSSCMRGNPQTSGEEGEEVAQATSHRTGGAIAFEERAGKPGGGKGILISDERTGAIRAGECGKKVFQYQGDSCDSNIYVIENHSGDRRVTIKEDGITDLVVTKTFALEGNGQRGSHKGCGYTDNGVMYTLNTVEIHAVCQHKVRRITPLECERLQAFPDNWTNLGEWVETSGKVHNKTSDTDRYRALGNSIALPFWAWLARRICAQYERTITMGSLFDGIGGFPLVFQRAGAIPVWASEIEEFCIAVTKRHFGEE